MATDKRFLVAQRWVSGRSARESREHVTGPNVYPMGVRVRTGDENGMGASAVPTVDVEQGNATGLNRVMVHVSLTDERTFQHTPVLRIVGRAAPADSRPDVDESKVDQPGVYIETPRGRWVPIGLALAMIDREVSIADAQAEARSEPPLFKHG